MNADSGCLKHSLCVTWVPNIDPARMPQRRAYHWDSESGRRRGEDGGALPATQYHGATYYRLKNQVRRHGCQRHQETEATGRGNRKLKHVVANLTLDNPVLKDVLSRKLVKPAGQWKAAGYLMEHYQM